MHRSASSDVEKTERVKAMPHSATLATRLGAELKARILPQRGDAALAPHKSSCFCLEHGGENKWSPPPSFTLPPSPYSSPLLLPHLPFLSISLFTCLSIYLPLYLAIYFLNFRLTSRPYVLFINPPLTLCRVQLAF